MATDRLLTEVQRQKKYLDRLGGKYTFPLFNSRYALESQRRSGYRHTASAAREIVDNAVEAGATRIDVIFARPPRLKEHQRKESVSAVAFIDNGSGMLSEMARFALSWGGGTHFDDPDRFGKFGFGLPNASINQTRRVEVYTKTADAKAITMAWLDIHPENVSDTGLQTVEPPVEADLPDFVQRHLKAAGPKFDHGTVVVWVAPDRLSYGTAAPLKEHLLDDFGVTYRYLLDDVEIHVEGVKVERVDPLFLDPAARYFVPADAGGAILSVERTIPVKYYLDKARGIRQLKKVEDVTELDEKDEDLMAAGSIKIRVARFPYGFVIGKKGKAETDAEKRFEFRKTRRGMSFVRAGREIETVDAFPRSARDEASGMGRWPLLQSYAYHWGIEVRFSPALDEVFGITNDKQTVRPIEDFWRLLAKEEIDRVLRVENDWQRDERKKEDVPKVTPAAETSPAEAAAAAADAIGGIRPRIPEHEKPKAQESFEGEVKRRVGVTAESIQEATEAVEADSRRRPYKIDYFDDPNGPFYEPSWELGSTVLVRINRLHPFYETLYAELLKLEGGARAKEAVDVLLIALGRGELTVEEELTKMWYQKQRTARWSPFLADALKILSMTTLRPTEEPEEGQS